MKTTNQYKLIEGKFNIQDSTSLVLNFFNTKIVFHNQQLMRMAELGIKDDGLIEKRIEELKHTKQSIIDFINKQKNDNELLEIEGYITIKKQ